MEPFGVKDNVHTVIVRTKGSSEQPLAARASYLRLPVVVGRARETTELAARLEAARHRSARALFISAPAGIGKSRLLQELELDARTADIRFALGQCRAEAMSVREPIEHALRVLARGTPPAVLDPLRPVLGKLVPSLAGREPARRFRDASEQQIAVYDALSRWLRALSETSPFVLCLEDLHWADSATLETLNVIIRALHGSRGLVVATFRSDELSRLSSAFHTIDEGLADHVELAPLSEQAVTTLVELALPGFHASAPLAARLYEATRGNVLFATECLRGLIEDGALTRVLGMWTAAPELAHRQLPRSIKQAVLARLATLPEPQLALYRRLAPAGTVLELSLIQAIADASSQDLFPILDDGVERQFLLHGGGRYCFTHPTVQEAIYETTPEPMRRRFHGRIAEHLLQVSGDRPEVARAIGYHFARSDEPTRAIDPLLRAAERALDDKALLEASGSLELAARLLEDNPEVADRAVRLITAWGTLIEIGYGCSAPTCIHYAEKLFAYWGETADLARGQVEMRLALAIAATSSAEQRAELLPELFQEIPIGAGMLPRDIFLKRAEYRILESIALALTGRTAELAAGLRQTAEDHPPESPYRAAASVAIGGLTPHTGQFRGVVAELREHIEVLRMFRGAVATCPRRLEWALGMGAYFMNLNLAVMGLPIDERATWHGLEIAERLGFTDLRSYHALSQLVRASFTGDGAAFTARFAELTELMRKLGDPRLSGRDLAIYTPLYYLERGELELARAAVQRGERLVMLVPGDHWLASYVEVYRACLLVAGGGSTAGPGASTAASATGFAASAMGSQASMSGSAVTEAAIEAAIEAATAAAITRALSAVRTPDFRMATLVLVYQSRFELGRGDVAAASAAAEAALARATDPLRVNPFDEILARRALADVRPGAPGLVELSRALALAVRTRNVLQEGIVRFALADRTWDSDRPQASQQLDLAEQQFAAARADRWLERARRRRKLGGDARP